MLSRSGSYSSSDSIASNGVQGNGNGTHRSVVVIRPRKLFRNVSRATVLYFITALTVIWLASNNIQGLLLLNENGRSTFYEDYLIAPAQQMLNQFSENEPSVPSAEQQIIPDNNSNSDNNNNQLLLQAATTKVRMRRNRCPRNASTKPIRRGESSFALFPT